MPRTFPKRRFVLAIIEVATTNLLGIPKAYSSILDFGVGTATFTCSTQLAPYQRVNIFGTGAGRYRDPLQRAARPCVMWHQQQGAPERIELPMCDQYTIKGDLFAQAVLNHTPVPTPLADAVANMRVLEAVRASGHSGQWKDVA